MKRLSVIILIVLLLSAFVTTGSAASEIAGSIDSAISPSNEYYVSDYAGVLTDEQRLDLLERAQQIFAQTGFEVVILSVDSLEGEDISSAGAHIMESWAIGGERSRGMLILLANRDGIVSVFVGKGMSARFTPAKQQRLLSDTLSPGFATGDYYGTLAAAMDELDTDLIAPLKPQERFGISSPMLIFGVALGGTVLAVSRSMRNARKAKARHDPYVYVRKPSRRYTQPIRDEDMDTNGLTGPGRFIVQPPDGTQNDS